MNEILHEIDVLTTLKRGVISGADKNMIVELLDAVIEKKKFEITMFETQMEKEYGTNCS